MSRFGTPDIYSFDGNLNDCGLFIFSAGFEERAIEFLSKSFFQSDAHCLMVEFEYDIQENGEIHKRFRDLLTKKFSPENIYKTTIEQNSPKSFDKNLDEVLSKIPKNSGGVWIDISGLPTHTICSTLYVVRNYFPNTEQNIIYTSADKYYPTYEEYKKIESQSGKSIEYLPKGIAQEMSEVLLLENFSGHRSREGVSCLAVFAGYDADRSAGVIDRTNPSALLLLYGNPGNQVLDWRLDLSRQLHKKFETTRKTATEVISTLNPNETIEVLERYYEYLFEDYDLTISPVCSKMQTVGVYLFWEQYKEVQLVFPLPIGYSLERRAVSIDKTYITKLAPRNSLFRDLRPTTQQF